MNSVCPSNFMCWCNSFYVCVYCVLHPHLYFWQFSLSLLSLQIYTCRAISTFEVLLYEFFPFEFHIAKGEAELGYYCSEILKYLLKVITVDRGRAQSRTQISQFPDQCFSYFMKGNDIYSRSSPGQIPFLILLGTSPLSTMPELLLVSTVYIETEKGAESVRHSGLWFSCKGAVMWSFLVHICESIFFFRTENNLSY